MSKKILPSLLVTVLIMLALLPCWVQAADIELVYDAADVLSYDEFIELNEQADWLADRYDFEAGVIVLEEMSEGYSEVRDYAEDIYHAYNFGRDSQSSGLLFLLVTSERDFALIAYGYGNEAITDYGKDVLLDDYLLPQLKNDNYYEAFSLYYEQVEEYLEQALEGQPFDIHTDPEVLAKAGRRNLLIKLALAILLPLLIAAGITGNWRRQMKTAVLATRADSYIPADGFKLNRQEDTFLFQTHSRRRIERKSSSGGGGSSVNSGGFSGRSGKY